MEQIFNAGTWRGFLEKFSYHKGPVSSFVKKTILTRASSNIIKRDLKDQISTWFMP